MHTLSWDVMGVWEAFLFFSELSTAFESFVALFLPGVKIKAWIFLL